MGWVANRLKLHSDFGVEAKLRDAGRQGRGRSRRDAVISRLYVIKRRSAWFSNLVAGNWAPRWLEKDTGG